MKRFDLFNLVETIYGYFRFKESPPSSVVDEWLMDLDYIDSDAVPYILKNLKELDTLPRNLPKVIRGIYSQYKRQNAGGVFVKYNPVEDLRFPIDKLYKAQEVYIKSGRGSFMEYCKANWMPTTDIERVENKVKHLFETGKVKKFIAGVGESINDLAKPPGQVEKLQEAQRQKNELQRDIPF